MIDVNDKRRCDAEIGRSAGPCQALAQWEIQASSGVRLHYCGKHKESRREPEHFRRATFADWRQINQ